MKQKIRPGGEKVRYPCNQCDYEATTEDTLKQHIGSFHEKVRYSKMGQN